MVFKCVSCIFVRKKMSPLNELSVMNSPCIHDQNKELLNIPAERSYKVGRFQVEVQANELKLENDNHPSFVLLPTVCDRKNSQVLVGEISAKKNSLRKRTFSVFSNYFSERSKSRGRSNTLPTQSESEEIRSELFSAAHPYASILNVIQGDTKVYRGGHIKTVSEECLEKFML